MSRPSTFTRTQNRELLNLIRRVGKVTVALVNFAGTYPELHPKLIKEVYECAILGIRFEARLETLRFYHAEDNAEPIKETDERISGSGISEGLEVTG